MLLYLPSLSPTAPQQLDALLSYGLPSSPRYSSLDAARELLRAAKSKGMPESPATASQLARVRELQLVVGGAAGEETGAAAAGEGMGMMAGGGWLLRVFKFRVQVQGSTGEYGEETGAAAGERMGVMVRDGLVAI